MKAPALIRPLILITALLVAPLLQAKKPQWKMIYDNDTTNLLNCDSPFRDTKAPRVFTDEMVRMSVREAAIPGMGAQILSPGLGWVPWWKSEIVPLKKHEEWFEAYYGKKPNVGEHRYLLAGGDMVDTFVDECHKLGQAAIISYRVNDAHFKEFAYNKEAYNPAFAHSTSQFYVEHPEFHRVPGGRNHWNDLVHNWTIEAARQHKLDIVSELIRNYPAIDGVELDFLRHGFFFPDDTPMQQRVAVMVDFIKKVRAVLDEMEKKDGKYRYLGARVHAYNMYNLWENLGFAPKAWQDAGVDFFNLSPNYATSQQGTSIAEVRDLASEAAIYGELTHTADTWTMVKLGYDDNHYRRLTKEMLETTARIYYARGADGVSFFNLAYYRAHGSNREKKGPFNEPLFKEMSILADKQALDNSPDAAYFFTRGHNAKFSANAKGTTKTYWMDMVPARGNGPATLRLLVLSEKEATHGELDAPEKVKREGWVVKINDVPLSPVKNTWGAYPLKTEIKAGFNKAEQYVAFSVPANLLEDGPNKVEISNDKVAQTMRLRFVEIFQNPK